MYGVINEAWLTFVSRHCQPYPGRQEVPFLPLLPLKRAQLLKCAEHIFIGLFRRKQKNVNIIRFGRLFNVLLMGLFFLFCEMHLKIHEYSV